MRETINQYRLLTAALIAAVTLAQYTILKIVAPLLQGSQNGDNGNLPALIQALVFFGTSTSLYILICRGGLLWYEHIGWKIINPGIDLSGEWRSEFFYDTEDSRLENASVEGKLTIEQTWYGALSISGIYSHESEVGASNSFWRTDTCNIIKREAGSPTLMFTYITQRSGIADLYRPGEEVRGVIELWFKQKDKNGKALLLEGPFFNFFGASRRGHATFHRYPPQTKRSKKSVFGQNRHRRKARSTQENSPELS